MILLAVSPKEAVELLNGNATSLVRSWKVPLGTAYIAVKKEKPYMFTAYGNDFGLTYTKSWSETHESGDKEWFCLDEVKVLNGLVVAKCEITGCKKVSFLDWRTDEYTKPMYHHTVSNLAALDKPMELSRFYPIACVQCNAPHCPKKPLTHLPSRWQKVEVGE